MAELLLHFRPILTESMGLVFLVILGLSRVRKSFWEKLNNIIVEILDNEGPACKSAGLFIYVLIRSCFWAIFNIAYLVYVLSFYLFFCSDCLLKICAAILPEKLCHTENMAPGTAAMGNMAK